MNIKINKVKASPMGFGYWVSGKYTGEWKDEYTFHVKMFDAPSEEYGMDETRVSKLTVKKNGVVVLNFDRGYDGDRYEMDEEDRIGLLVYLDNLPSYDKLAA